MKTFAALFAAAAVAAAMPSAAAENAACALWAYSNAADEFLNN